ncbi:MAG: FAD/NAD(P)-binding protein [Chloroflexota bacterium]
MSNQNVMIPTVGKLVQVKDIAPEVKMFGIELTKGLDNGNSTYRPGQFAFISAFGSGEAPFGIASAVEPGGVLEFAVQRLGGVTTALHELAEGDSVGVRGPLGNWFPMDEFKGHNLLVVGGGIGSAPLRPVIQEVAANRSEYGDLSILMAARTPQHHLFLEDYPEWENIPDCNLHLTVDECDEDWKCEVGLVTDLLKITDPKPKDTIAIMCGPPIMIYYADKVLVEMGFSPEERYVTLEARMHCGVGKCGRCNLGETLVCVDGPVFSMDQVGEFLESYL